MSVAFQRVRTWFSPAAVTQGVWLSMCRAIQRAHVREMQRLSRAETAPGLGLRDAYCRLARWLPAPRDGGAVLELGCGPGKYVALLHGLRHRVVGVDPLKFAEWDAVRDLPGVELRDGVFAEELPFADATFDHVVCLGTLLYVRDPVQALAEMYRVLRPGGVLVVRTVNRLNYRTLRTGKPLDPSSKHLYDMDQLTQQLRDARLEVLDSYAYGLMPPVGVMFYWYLVSVWLPYWFQDFLSSLTPRRNRWNNIVLARKP